MTYKSFYELPPATSYSKQNYEYLRQAKRYEENRKKWKISDWESCTALIIVGENGDVLYSDFDTVCHADMSNSCGAIGFVSYYRDETGGLGSWYNNYLLHRSKFSKAFVGIDDTAFYLRADLPANYVAGAAIATRLPWEYPETTALFKEFVDLGMDEDIAFCMAPVFRSALTNSKIWIEANPQTYHSWGFHESLDTVINYVSGKFLLTKKNSDTGESYYGVDKLFSECREDITRILKKNFKTKNEEKVSNNPWQMALDNFNKRNYQNNFEFVVITDEKKEFVDFCNNELLFLGGEK